MFVLVHGAGGGGWEWAVWSRVLQAHEAAVRAPDLRAAGADGGDGSWRGTNGAEALAATTLDDYVAQVDAEVAACPEPPVLVGASLGGLLAACVAASRPVRALVLINALPPLPWCADLPPMGAVPDVVDWGRRASLASTRRALPDADDATCEWAWRKWRDESGAVLRAARAGRTVVRPEVPVLMLASEGDTDVPPAVSRAWAGAWSATLWSLPGASHVGPLLGRGAAAVAERVVTWSRRLPSTPEV